MLKTWAALLLFTPINGFLIANKMPALAARLSTSDIFMTASNGESLVERPNVAVQPLWDRSDTARVTISDLEVNYEANGMFRQAKSALHDVNLALTCSAPIALVGDSGSGKSTFLKCLAGKQKPTHGTVDITGDRAVVYLIRGFSYEGGSTVVANIRSRIVRSSPHEAEKLSADELTERAMAVLAMAAVDCRADVIVRDLSGGDVLRFGLAMALARGALRSAPPLLLCDEYLDQEDGRVRVRVEGIMKQMSREHGVGFIFSSHSMSAVFELAQAAIVFSGGEVIQVGPPSEMAYVRRLFEQKMHRMRQAKQASDIMARTIDNLVHFRAPSAKKPKTPTK